MWPFVWLLSLGIMFSVFIHVVVRIGTSFLFYGWIVPVWIYCILLISFSVDGYLGWFYYLAIINNAAYKHLCTTSVCMDIHFQFSWVSIPRSEIVGTHFLYCLFSYYGVLRYIKFYRLSLEVCTSLKSCNSRIVLFQFVFQI